MHSEHAHVGEAGPAQRFLLPRLFVPFALGYFLSYFFRNINAVIVPQLMTEFHLGAPGVGLLTSAYLLCFAAMQLPIGLMVDRYGPRRVQAALLATAALGAAAFALGESAAALALARGVIGAGVAGSLMVSFAAFVIWLPPDRVPAMSGFLMAFGGLGAFAAGAPAERYIAAGGGWRDLFLFMAALTFAASCIVFAAVPERARPGSGNLRALLAGLIGIYRDRVFWRVAPLAIFALGSAFALPGLWAGPWLMQVAQRDSQAVGVHLSAWAVALLAGSVACGSIAKLGARFGLNLLQCVAVLALGYIVALAGLVLQFTDASMFLWCTMGFLTNPMSLAYLALSQRFDASLAARVNTGVNALVLVGSFFMQWTVGAVIGLWTPLAPGVYPAQAFQASFGMVLACIVAAWLWFAASLARESGATPSQ